MTKSDLLKRSIKEFKDKQDNCIVYEVDRYFTKSGYCFIIKKNPKEISAAIHYNVSFETDDKVGKYENNDVEVNTNTQLPLDCIIQYKDLTFAISKQGNYNSEMGVWHYTAQSSFKPISDKFLITSEADIVENIGCNSCAIISDLSFNYPIVPSYYAATNKTKYVMLSILESVGETSFINKDNKLYQRKKDKIKLSFVNIDTKDSLEFLYQLQEYSLSPISLFGINSIGTLQDDNLYQKSFNWKSLTTSIELFINYVLEVKGDNTQKILDIFYKKIMV